MICKFKTKIIYCIHRFTDRNQTLPVPTHFYMIIVKCRKVGVYLPCNGDVNVVSYILPHVEKIPNCLVSLYRGHHTIKLHLVTTLHFIIY